MSRTPRTSTGPARPRIVGTPGRSTRGQYRQLVDAYRYVHVKWLALGFILAVTVVGAGAHSIGNAAAPAMLGFAALVLVADLIVRFPSAAATVVVVAVSGVLASPFAQVYAAAANKGNVDQVGAIGTLLATLALTGLLAHRTSRGRPWVTTLIVAVGITFVGPFFLILAPWMGFAWAWTVMALVLFLRGGGTAWAVDQCTKIGDVLHRRKNPATPRPDHRPGTDRDAKRDAEVLTADLLADLPAGYTVFHNRRLPAGVLLNHLVVGPAGVFLIESQKFKGRVVEDRTRGLVHSKVSIGDLLNDTDTAAALVADALRVKDVHVAPVVVIHDAVLPATRSRVALSTDATTLGVVTVIAPSTLLTEVTNATEATGHDPVLTDRQTRRVVARIDRCCPPASNKPVKPGVAKVAVQVRVLDENGNPKTDEPATAAQPLFVSSHSTLHLDVGQAVTVLTDQGSFTGFRVTGTPVTGDDGITQVPLSRTPAAVSVTGGVGDLATETWFPLDSVQPDNN